MDRHYLRTILWLRWRLTRNQWSRGGWLNAVLTMIILIGGFVLGLLGVIAGVLLGYFKMAKFSPGILLGFWDAIILAFLFFWMIGLVSEIQRSESIDISKMLHMPISLNDIFVVNYLASHLTLSNSFPACDAGIVFGAASGQEPVHGSDVSAGARFYIYDNSVDVLPAGLACHAHREQTPPPCRYCRDHLRIYIGFSASQSPREHSSRPHPA